MRQVLLVLAIMPCCLGCATISPLGILKQVGTHDLAIRAVVLDVGDSPGYWSGVSVACQPVKYRVVEVYKGDIAVGDEILVYHVLVGGGPTEHGTEARLNENLVKPGIEVVLFADTCFPGMSSGNYVVGGRGADTVFFIRDEDLAYR